MEKLTPLERDVTQWMMLGKSNADVATILGKHPLTIKIIIRRITLKFRRRNEPKHSRFPAER